MKENGAEHATMYKSQLNSLQEQNRDKRKQQRNKFQHLQLLTT